MYDMKMMKRQGEEGQDQTSDMEHSSSVSFSKIHKTTDSYMGINA